jgi:hypothetical protein
MKNPLVFQLTLVERKIALPGEAIEGPLHDARSMFAGNL